QQKLELVLAADQRRQAVGVQGIEAALDRTRPQYLPSRHRLGDAAQSDGAEVATLEEATDQPPRRLADQQRVWLGHRLQPGGEVRRFADDATLLGRALADQVADDDQTGSDADPGSQARRGIEAWHALDQRETRPHGPLGVVLLRLGVAEIHQHAVAHIFGDEAA